MTTDVAPRCGFFYLNLLEFALFSDVFSRVFLKGLFAAWTTKAENFSCIVYGIFNGLIDLHFTNYILIAGPG
jgi:hypothetical protein